MESDGWRIVSNPGGWSIVSIRTNQPTALHEGMHRLICKLAWQYSRGTSLSAHDLISEGYVALLLAEDKYDPERAAKSTFVYWVVRNHFLGLRKRWGILAQDLTEHLVCDDSLSTLENADEFRFRISALTEEAKQVIKILVDCPTELMNIAKCSVPERLQNAVVKLLRRRGVDRARIQILVAEIKSAIQKL